MQRAGLYRAPVGVLTNRLRPDHPLMSGLVGMFGWVDGQLFEHLSGRWLTQDNSSSDLVPELDDIAGARIDRYAGDATNDRWYLSSINSADKLSLNGADGITVIADIHMTKGSAGTFPRILDKSTSGGSTGGYGLIISEAASPDALIIQAGGNSSNAGTSLTLNSEYDGVVGVTSEDLSSFDFWLDGDTYATTSSSLTIATTTANLSIGNANHANQQWEGLIRRVWLYERGLSDGVLRQALDRTACWDLVDDRVSYFLPPSGGGGGSIAPLAYHHRQMMRAA